MLIIYSGYFFCFSSKNLIKKSFILPLKKLPKINSPQSKSYVIFCFLESTGLFLFIQLFGFFSFYFFDNSTTFDELKLLLFACSCLYFTILRCLLSVSGCVVVTGSFFLCRSFHYLSIVETSSTLANRYRIRPQHAEENTEKILCEINDILLAMHNMLVFFSCFV